MRATQPRDRFPFCFPTGKLFPDKETTSGSMCQGSHRRQHRRTTRNRLSQRSPRHCAVRFGVPHSKSRRHQRAQPSPAPAAATPAPQPSPWPRSPRRGNGIHQELPSAMLDSHCVAPQQMSGRRPIPLGVSCFHDLNQRRGPGPGYDENAAPVPASAPPRRPRGPAGLGPSRPLSDSLRTSFRPSRAAEWPRRRGPRARLRPRHPRPADRRSSCCPPRRRPSAPRRSS